MKFGIDAFLQTGERYKQRRFALVTNHAATTAEYRSTREILLQAGYRIVLLFAPEHGLMGTGEDGQAIQNSMDPQTGLPVVSLYGSRLAPEPQQLAEVDAVLFDLPDIGCRFYTYLWTLSHVMEACLQSSKELVIFDRPNPISGDLTLVEGPILDEKHCSSFIGRWSIPLRHSCSIGELARLWQKTRLERLDLTIFPAEGWNRSMYHSDWANSFVPTSPAMTDAEAALLYPGLGLLEATNLSEGRGTALPFRIVGAPWIKAMELVKACNDLQLPGIWFRDLDFTPTTGPYRRQGCHGVILHVIDRLQFRPVFTALMLIRLIKDLYPNWFHWSRYVSNVNVSGEGHLDRLLGIFDAEDLFELSLPEFQTAIPRLLSCPHWAEVMQPHLYY